MQHLSVLIVGGGVAGLHTAMRLDESGVKSVKLFESRPEVGGRIQTTRDENGKPLFNNFAWRIENTNVNMLALVKELGVEIRLQVTPTDAEKPPSSLKSGKPLQKPSKGVDPTPKGRAPLSAYATQSLTSTTTADKQDRESGYAGHSSLISFPGETTATKYYVVSNGMNEIVHKLAERLPQGVVNTNQRCKDVKKLADGKYQVDIVVRTPGKETYKMVSYTCDTLVLAAPPRSLRGFTVAKEGLLPVLSAVDESRLMHIYAWSSSENVPDRSDVKDRIYEGFEDSILQQVVSGDYGPNGVFQAAYACGRFERVWRELQFQGPDIVKKEVEKQLAMIDLPRLKGIEIDKVQICTGIVHHWQQEAHVNGKTKEELMTMAVYPSPIQLPRLHLIGEAFSSKHAWTEGALLTSILAVDYIKNKKLTSVSKFAQPIKKHRRKKNGNEMVYNGLVVDISQWRDRHPGGFGPISGHGNEDITELFDNYHAGWTAPLATIFGLQSGVVEE
jgi:cytochrome b involved in lipid metabolism